MKRNARSLADMCVFSTMIMVTLICTASVFTGQKDAIDFMYPMDAAFFFDNQAFVEREDFLEKIESTAKSQGVKVEDQMMFTYARRSLIQEENVFYQETVKENIDQKNYQAISLMSLEAYNLAEGGNVVLEEDEVLIFSEAKDFGNETIQINGKTYRVKEELQTLSFTAKDEKNVFGGIYYIIMPNQNIQMTLAKELEDETFYGEGYTVKFNLQGDEEAKAEVIKELMEWCEQVQGFKKLDHKAAWAKQSRTMNGGLLFLGLFFGIVFTICLVLNMYYKQLSEGYEDKKNFAILKQVGMSDEQVRSTIRRQILITFFYPLGLAILHTMMGLFMVQDLLGVLNLYNTRLIYGCSGVVIICFTLVYTVSYWLTGRAYYRIVK